MLYSRHIPDNLRASEKADKLVSVLDEIQKYKESVINKAMRVYSPALLTLPTFIRKQLKTFGWPDIPTDFPKKILDNMFFNAENVFRTKGSRYGLEYLIRVLTCGDLIYDDTTFAPRPNYIILDDIDYGYLFDDASYPDDILYLFDGDTTFNPRFLYLTIRTPYYNLQSLKDYITTNIHKFIGFTDTNTTVYIEFLYGPHRLNPMAHYYFEDLDELPVPGIEIGYSRALDGDSTLLFTFDGFVDVDWGDGTTATNVDATAGLSHVYATGDAFTAKIKPISGVRSNFALLSSPGVTSVNGGFPATLQTLNLGLNPDMSLAPSIPVAVTSLSVQSNQLPGWVISRILIELANNGLSTGTLNASQSSIYTLTPAGTSARDLLLSRGWTLNL